MHHFNESPPISTYITCCIAGPYASIVKEDLSVCSVPMTIYSRKSKIGNIDGDAYFKVWDSAIKFYEELLGTPFPWEKFDNVFVPEFRIRGMENVGTTCMAEFLVFSKEESTDKTTNFLLKVMCHEVAHSWFGDLVTVKWWD